eukprot:6479524-Amphidinium_carterae.1
MLGSAFGNDHLVPPIGSSICWRAYSPSTSSLQDRVRVLFLLNLAAKLYVGSKSRAKDSSELDPPCTAPKVEQDWKGVCKLAARVGTLLS